MNISLTRRLQQLVQEHVRSGRYQSASEVVREALRLLEDVEQLRTARVKALRKAIDAGLADLDRGRAVTFDARSLATIKARARSRRSRKSG
jgi:antitoxin ParD1/3/4